MRAVCERDGRILVPSQYGGYPYTGDGVAVRHVFHKLRSTAIENFNGQFKGIFDVRGRCPLRG